MAADDTVPQGDPKPLTEEEREQAAMDWAEYRKVYGANGAPAVLRAEHRAFLAGWLARRHHAEVGPWR